MSQNKLHTLGYFRQRLHHSGISSKILIKEFDDVDSRKWMISVFDDLRIVCTCFKPNDWESDYYFEFRDGKNCLKQTYTFRTKSMNVIIRFLFSLSRNSDYEQPGSTETESTDHTEEAD